MRYLVKKTENGYVVKHKTDAKHLPREGGWFFAEGPDTKYPKVGVSPEGVIEIVEDSAPMLIAEAWEEMDSGIVADSAPVFKTTNRESMLAFVDDYQLRIMVPEMFIGDGEVTEVITPSFGIGMPLDTAEKIKSYYAEVLYELLQKRRNRIRDFVIYRGELLS